jgi:hypothetical protein
VLAARCGLAAMDAVRDGRFGEMAALRADEIRPCRCEAWPRKFTTRYAAPLGDATR